MSEEEPRCPICREHSLAQNLESQGVVLTGVRALFEGDEPTIRNVYEHLSQYDGHTAIGLCALFLNDLSILTGIPIDEWLDRYRRILNAEQAKS